MDQPEISTATYRLSRVEADGLHHLAKELGFVATRGIGAARKLGNASAMLRALYQAYQRQPQQIVAVLKKLGVTPDPS